MIGEGRESFHSTTNEVPAVQNSFSQWIPDVSPSQPIDRICRRHSEAAAGSLVA